MSGDFPIRRGFVDASFGQVHYRTGGSDGDLPLVMLHSSASSSRMMLPLIRELVRRRRVFALDTPGNGESDPLPMEAPEMTNFVEAAWEALDGLKINRFDLYGTHFGTRLATEMAIQQPNRIRKLVLDGEGLPSDALLQTLLQRVAPDIIPDHQAIYLTRTWHYIRDYYLFFPWYETGTENRRPTGLPSAETLHEKLLEVLHNGRTYGRSYRAGLRYPLEQRLPLVPVPTLIATAVTDNALPCLDQLAACLPHARKLRTPGFLTLDAAAQTAAMFLDFLSEPEVHA